MKAFDGGDGNIAIGNNILPDADEFTYGNILIGTDLGLGSTRAGDNVIVGENNSVYTNPYGTTGIGYGPILQGEYAVGVGYFASSEERGVAIGGYSSANGFVAVAIGTFTTNSSNDYATIVGYQSKAFAARSGAFGYGAIANSADELVIGNITPSSIGGYANWSNLSDGRFKYDVQENVPGIDFIKKLRPVTYKVDREKVTKFIGGEELLPEQKRLLGKTETGFIAQEVEKVAKELDYAFDGIHVPDDKSKEHYKVSYATFVVPLVKATQEQQVKIELLTKELEIQKAKTKALESRLNDIARQLSEK